MDADICFQCRHYSCYRKIRYEVKNTIWMVLDKKWKRCFQSQEQIVNFRKKNSSDLLPSKQKRPK